MFSHRNLSYRNSVKVVKKIRKIVEYKIKENDVLLNDYSVPLNNVGEDSRLQIYDKMTYVMHKVKIKLW